MCSKKIVLIQGGMGEEREVSLSTGQAFEQALKELGYDYEIIDADKDFVKKISQASADMALLALHGKYAEDGVVQGVLEYLKMPYSGSGVLSSALCMDKVVTKQLLWQNNIPTAPGQTYDLKLTDVHNITQPKKYPIVVKPSREGSSVGISIVKEPDDFYAAIKEAAQYDHMILVEDFVDGKEVTVPVLGDKPLTPIEIVPKIDFYNYENKYTKGKTDYILPARLTEKTIDRIKDLALQAFKVCRMRTYGRVDFRLNKDEVPFVLEVNTLPGCTPTSLVPKSAAHDGISFNEFIQQLIEGAGLDYEGLS